MARRDRRSGGNSSGVPPRGGNVPDAVRRSMEALEAHVADDEAIDTTEAGRRSKALRERGHDLSEQGRVLEAHALYKEAASLFAPHDNSPAAACCWYDLGQSYDNLPHGVREENLRHARDLFERSLRSPSRGRVPLRLALTHDALGRMLRALAEHARGDEARDLFAEAEKHYAQAFRTAEATGPVGLRDAASYHFNLANLQMQRRRFDEAERHYRRALDLLNAANRDPCRFVDMLPTPRSPLRPLVRVALARLQLVRGRRRELMTALRALEAALPEAPPPVAAEVHLLAANACMKLSPQRPDEARAHLRAIDPRSLRLDQRAPYVEALREVGETDIARRVLRQMLDDAMAKRMQTLADHVSDHAAREAQDCAHLGARLHLDEGRPVEAFLALEETAALRYMERVFTHTGLTADPLDLALGVWHGALSSVAVDLDQLAAMAAHQGEAEGRRMCEEARSHFETAPDPASSGVPLLDHERPRAHAVARQRRRDALQRAAQASSVVTVLREAAQNAAAEAQRLRSLRAQRDPAAHQAHLLSTTALDVPRLRALLAETPDEVLLRIHLDHELMVVAVWLDGAELKGCGSRRPLTREEAKALEALHLAACGVPPAAGEDGGEERVTEALEALLPAFDVCGVLPEGHLPHIIVLPSRLAALVPWVAAGAAGATLLDRADAISYLPNLAPRLLRQQVLAPRSGTLLVAPGEHCAEQPTRFHDVAFAELANDEDILFGEQASLDAVVKAAGSSDVVSVYAHGLHLAGRGAEIALAGESLSLDALGGEWIGCERVELWACQSGVNVPTAPLIPWVDEAFGIDVAFHYAGARSTIGSLWSVPAFVTAHLVRRYRRALAAHGNPPRALADAQRWWRDHVIAELPTLLARTPEIELPGAVTALLGVDVTSADLASTLGPLRATALMPPAAQRHVVRMFSSAEAWAGFRFLGVAGRRPEVLSADARRALTPDERAELDELLFTRPAEGQDIDALDRERLNTLRVLDETGSPTPTQAIAVARAYAERGLGAMRHNLLRGAAWVHEALAAPGCSDEERRELLFEAAWLWTEMARGELDTEMFRPVYPADPALVVRARTLLDARGPTATTAPIEAWLELLTRQGDGLRAPDPARWHSLRDAIEATTASWPRLRALALTLEWLLAHVEVPVELAQEALALAEANWPTASTRENYCLLERVHSACSSLGLALECCEFPPSPYALSSREILRSVRWANRAHELAPDAHIDPQKECSAALDRLEGKYWGLLHDGLDDFWDSSGLPGPAWQQVTAGFFTGRFHGAPEPRLALHHIASLQLGADLRLGALHRCVRSAPYSQSIPGPHHLAWQRELLLQRLDDLARLPDEVASQGPHSEDAFRISPAALLEAGTRSPSALTGWDAMVALGAEKGGHPAARTGAFLLERTATELDERIHDTWAALRQHLSELESRTSHLPVDGARLFLENLAPPRRIADLEEDLRALPERYLVLGVSIGALGELLLSVCARVDGAPQLHTLALAETTGWQARDALLALLVPQPSDDTPLAGMDASRAEAFLRLRACFDEALGRCLDGLPGAHEQTLMVFAPGPLRGLPWGALTTRGIALRDRFAAVTTLPWLGFEGTPPAEEGDGSKVLCALGEEREHGETCFGARAIRTLRDHFRNTLAAEPAARPRSMDIVETERLGQVADRVEVVRWYGVGYHLTLNASTEGLALAYDRTLSPRNLVGTRLPHCHRVEYWAATGALGSFLATASGDRDVFPALVWSALAAGARGVLDLAWPVHDLVKALVCERFGIEAARGTVAQSVALGAALRAVGALLFQWRASAASFDSVRAALAWLDEARSDHARRHGLDPSCVVPFASAHDAPCVARDLNALMEVTTSPEQLGAFRWWGT